MNHKNEVSNYIYRIARVCFLALTVIVQAVGGTAYARNAAGYLPLFRTAYPAAVGTRIDSCGLCHTNATNPGSRNTYGSEWASSTYGNHTFNATLGARDSDGDGRTNNAEIAALTFPGNASDPPPAAGAMAVTPGGGLTSTGTQGGPFSPLSVAYTLTNTGGSTINWTASKSAQTWATLSSTAGTLAAGTNATVTVSINSAVANGLAAGSYGDNVTFTNSTNGTGNTTRPVNLTVVGAPPITPPSGQIDFDGDGKTDLAVWRLPTGMWYIKRSSDNVVTAIQWGLDAMGDNVVAGDYDGDGKADVAVWRSSNGNWYVKRSSDNVVMITSWGSGSVNDAPVPGDYDGDGKTDVAVWRPGTGNWYVKRSSDNVVTITPWGSGSVNDAPVPGDYDGDGKTDVAVWRPGTGNWYVKRSSDGGVTTTLWGAGAVNDVPVPGDYDGDGKTDVAVWRPGTGTWYVLRSSDGGVTSQNWGLGSAGDVPMMSKY